MLRLRPFESPSRSAPALDEVSRCIEFHNGWRRDTAVSLRRLQVREYSFTVSFALTVQRLWPMNDPDITLRVDGNPGNVPQNPIPFGKLGPGGIYLEHWRSGLVDGVRISWPISGLYDPPRVRVEIYSFLKRDREHRSVLGVLRRSFPLDQSFL